jgi:hypothetical protein
VLVVDAGIRWQYSERSVAQPDWAIRLTWRAAFATLAPFAPTRYEVWGVGAAGTWNTCHGVPR